MQRHVASQSQWGEATFNQLFTDSLYAFHHRKGSNKSREEIAQEYYNRPDKAANILAPLEIQHSSARGLPFTSVRPFGRGIAVSD